MKSSDLRLSFWKESCQTGCPCELIAKTIINIDVTSCLMFFHLAVLALLPRASLIYMIKFTYPKWIFNNACSQLFPLHPSSSKIFSNKIQYIHIRWSQLRSKRFNCRHHRFEFLFCDYFTDRWLDIWLYAQNLSPNAFQTCKTWQFEFPIFCIAHSLLFSAPQIWNAFDVYLISFILYRAKR